MPIDKITVNGVTYGVHVTYEERKNSQVSIGRRSINIRLPSFLNREEAFRQLFQMKNWAKKKLEEQPERAAKEPKKEYKDGDILNIGGENYALKIEFRDKQSSSARFDGSVIHFAISSALPREKQHEHVSTLMSRCVARKRLPTLIAKINELNSKYFNQKVNKVFFKNLASRWGSCSENGNINISTRLLFAPDDVLEYVCVHELAHLIEKNHSPAFWSLVEKAMPDHKEKRKWLKENGNRCVF